MSSMLSSQAVVLATAMAAFSGTVIVLAFKLQKSNVFPSNNNNINNNNNNSLFHLNPLPVLRPCLSSGDRKAEKKKKKVTFAEDVMDTKGDNQVFRRQFDNILNKNNNDNKSKKNGDVRNKRMPANRVALYNGILRDRVIHRVTYSY